MDNVLEDVDMTHATTPTDLPECQYCNSRPVSSGRSKTCGEPECKRAKQRERDRARYGVGPWGISDRVKRYTHCVVCKTRPVSRYDSSHCGRDECRTVARERRASIRSMGTPCRYCERPVKHTGDVVCRRPKCIRYDRLDAIRLAFDTSSYPTCLVCGMAVPRKGSSICGADECIARANDCSSWMPLSPEVFKRDRFVCQICDEPTSDKFERGDLFSPTVDHIVPRTKGGSLDDMDNLQTAHFICNLVKGNRHTVVKFDIYEDVLPRTRWARDVG